MSTHEPLFWHAVRSLCRWGLCALIAWLLLIVLLAGMQQAQPVERAFSLPALFADLTEPGFFVRMRELTVLTVTIWIWPTAALAVFFLLQVVVGALVPLMGLPGTRAAVRSDAARTPYGGEETRAMPPWMWPVAAAGVSALKFGAMFFAGFAVLWAGFSVAAFMDGRDHWEALPMVTPPYLSEFLARHPGLSADRGTDTSGMLTLRDDKGNSMLLHGSELAAAEASFDGCPPQFDAEQLGGIAPYPGAACAAVLYLRNEAGEHRIYMFGIKDDSDIPAIEAHFKRLSDANAFSSAGSSKSRRRYSFGARSSDEAWHVQVNAEQGGATSILVRHTLVKAGNAGDVAPQR